MASSFRDPAGRTFRRGLIIHRQVYADEAPRIKRLLDSTLYRSLTEAGFLIPASPAAPPGGHEQSNKGLWLTHSAVPFVSYPHEWSAELLMRAAVRTLDVLDVCLAHGHWLKDATPYNIVFDGSEARFCDILSIEPATASAWPAYGQFLRTFVLPLFAEQRFGRPVGEIFAARRDGLQPRDVRKGWLVRDWLRTGPLFHVLLPYLFRDVGNRDRQSSDRAPNNALSQRDAFTLHRLSRSLRRFIATLSPPDVRTGEWRDYETQRSHYEIAELVAKDAAVDSILSRTMPATVLDLGCNAGQYACAAAKGGARVLAIDSDSPSIDALTKRNFGRKLNITPAVLNIARPTPAIGWLNTECPSFLERVDADRPQLVLALAIIHHLLVGERLPLMEVINLFARLTARNLLVEWVSPDDEKFMQIAGPNIRLYRGLSESAFVAALEQRFSMVERHEISATRSLFLMRTKI